MAMDEAGSGPWTIDPETLAALRLQKAEEALQRDDPDMALVEAEEYLEMTPGAPEALRISGQAALQLGDAWMARVALEALADTNMHTTDDLILLGVARFENADINGARDAARLVLDRNPKLAAAWQYLGVAEERLGNAAASAMALTRAHELDPKQHALPSPVAESVWTDALGRALRSLPGPIRAFYSGVAIDWEEFPSVEELHKTTPPLSPFVDALYDGVPPEDGDPWLLRPARVRLFRANLGRPVPALQELSERIGHALLHEAVDWIGITEDQPWGSL